MSIHITATRPTPATTLPPRHATCQRCGITFQAHKRTPNDRQHCRDCKPYTRKDN